MDTYAVYSQLSPWQPHLEYPSPALSNASPYPPQHFHQLGPTRVTTRRQAQKVMARQRPYPRLNLDSTPLRHVPYDPMTPSSTPSPYARPFDPPRAPSPALSTVSALTSASAADLPAPSRPKQKKQRLDNNDRKRICKFHDEHPNCRQEDIANEFGVERSTISKILKQKSKWLSAPDNPADRVAKHRPSKFPEIEEELSKWLQECAAKKLSVSDTAIRDKAKEIARGLEISDEKFKASSGWVENFKSRQKLRGAMWPSNKPSSSARLIDTHTHAHDPNAVLSPLNPSYRSELDSVSPDCDDDHDEDMHPESSNQAEPSAIMSMPTGSWNARSADISPLQPSPLSAHSHSSTHSHSSIGSEAMPPPLDPHLTVPSPSGVAVPVPVPAQAQQPAADYLQQEYYTPVQPQRIPTIAEAEDHIDALVLFLDVRARDGLITREERAALQNIKIALFQESHQINPFVRE